jgi:esterase/lipase superfamily enzyme
VEPESAAATVGKMIEDSYSDTQAVDVLYATNRELKGEAACSDNAFGVTQAQNLAFGLCRINVPKTHKIGSIETGATRGDPEPHKYFRILDHRPLTDSALLLYLQNSKTSRALVFVHGFNVKFEEALLRSAQIAYDLKHKGPIIVLSWPAGSGNGYLERANLLKTYDNNRMNAASSVAPAARFFRMLSTLDRPIVLVVHSMGHQVVIPALANLASELSVPFVDELVLNAPDIDVKTFQALAPSMRKLSRRTTVYCSFNDRAMLPSEFISKMPRMGACESIEGVDVINAKEIDAPLIGLGHGYYYSRPILTDVAQILMGLPPEKRLFIRRSEPNSVEKYHLRP